MLSIIFGLIFLIGGLTGKIPMPGMEDGRQTALIGLLLIAWGVFCIWREVQKIKAKEAKQGKGGKKK